MKVRLLFAAEFYKGYWRNDQLEGGVRVGVVVAITNKKAVTFKDRL